MMWAKLFYLKHKYFDFPTLQSFHKDYYLGWSQKDGASPWTPNAHATQSPSPSAYATLPSPGSSHATSPPAATSHTFVPAPVTWYCRSSRWLEQSLYPWRRSLLCQSQSPYDKLAPPISHAPSSAFSLIRRGHSSRHGRCWSCTFLLAPPTWGWTASARDAA